MTFSFHILTATYAGAIALSVLACTDSPGAIVLNDPLNEDRTVASGHVEMEVRRTEYGGDLSAVYRLCTCGHGVVFESNAPHNDPEPWNYENSTTFFEVNPDVAIDLAQKGTDVIDAIGAGTALSIGAWTDLSTEEISIFTFGGRRSVKSYWQGASSQSKEDVRQYRRIMSEYDPNYPSAKLDQFVLVAHFSVALRDALLYKEP